MTMRKLAAVLFLAAPAIGAAAQPAGQWSIVPSPNSSATRTNNYVMATACAAASDCWAVGYYSRTVGTYQTLVQHWDGAAWTLVPSPNTGPTQNNILRGVTCASANDCWAVGASSEPGSAQRTLVLHWDGAAWAIVPSANSSGADDYNYLFGVSCSSASECWAVGYHSTGGGFATLVQRWDGASWARVASPNAASASQNFLEGVTCAADACWAVGWSVDPATGFNRTMVQRWTGSAWILVSSPNALLATHNDLHGVTCATANECWAVGSSDNGNVAQTLALRWDGSAWSVVSSPSTQPTEANALRAVACNGASECWAAGSYESGELTHALVLRWNGSAWARATTASAPASSTVFGVACAGACWTAGFHDDAGLMQARLERWTGTAWTAATAPNYTAPQNNTLLGVACPAAGDCWAVASYFNGNVQQTLVEHWDGAAWSVRASPNTGGAQSNILYDVACTATDDCWIAGYALGDAGWQTLTLHWDGAAWGIVPSPSVPGGNNFLTDVDCVTASDCWAVGFHDTGVYQTLALHWDGAQWSLAESANTDLASENRLSGVRCVAANDCWAVGFHKIEGFLQRTLVQHWDGAAWTIVASPNVGDSRNTLLEDVACESAQSCWAVGSWSPGALGTGQPVILRWDGAAWRDADAPLPGPGENTYLRGVTCAPAGDCWAVGEQFTEGNARTLVERWNGAAWSVFASPNAGVAHNNRLAGVACAPEHECWSVGYSTDEAGIFHTLTQRYAVPARAPAAFAFLERANVATSVFVTSETVTLQGFDGGLAVSVDANGQYRINGGAWVSGAGQVGSGDRLAVRHLSAAQESTPTQTAVSVGAYTTTFRSVTSALDRTPDAFSFGTKAGVEPGAVVESDPVTPVGYNAGVAVMPGAGLAWRLDDGAWQSGSGTLAPGQSLQVRHVASATSLGYARTYLKVGGITAYFTTRTK